MMDATQLDAHMLNFSYVAGYSPSSADVAQFDALAGKTPSGTHASRWYRHIASFEAKERAAWPAGAAGAAGAADDEDDDDSLFGDDSGDDAAAEAAKAKLVAKTAEAAASLKAKEAKARSMIVFEVKPYDAETDLRALCAGIKSLTHEGIQNWGQEHKFEDVAFGIQKLVIAVVVFDVLIDTDTITDMIMDKFEDEVQSIDIQAFSKV